MKGFDEKTTPVAFHAILLCAVMMLTMVSFALAQEIQLPRISIEELKAQVESGNDIVIIDTQPKNMYTKFGHIKGAVSLPWAKQIDPMAVQRLPRDKPVVVYCDCGPGESDSNDVGNQLKRLGFKQVKVLADPSISGWIEKGYPVER